MLNIKEEQGLPDLHGYHPAFRCREKKNKIQNIQSMWSILWSKIECAENTELCVSDNTLVLSCNMQKILLMEKESVIIMTDKPVCR